MTSTHPAGPRTRTDRCPGILRPWPAADGALVRLRLPGGRLTAGQLRGLSALAVEHGDGDLHLTSRANVQLRALPAVDGRLVPAVPERIAALGLLPSPAHDLVRNVLVSPQTGLAGGRADLRPVTAELDERIRASDELAALPGRFLFVLDDGRGDLLDRDADLGCVALDPDTVQLRIGSGWGPIGPLADAAADLVALAARFVRLRGDGPAAAWHVHELSVPLAPPTLSAPPDPRTRVRTPPLPAGRVPGGVHLVATDGVLDADAVRALTRDLANPCPLVITPWRGVLVPDPQESA